MNKPVMKLLARAGAVGLILVPLLSGVSAFGADIQGAIIKINHQRVPETGVAPIRWLPAQKRYLVTVKGGIQLQITPDQVLDVDVPPPVSLKAAASAVDNQRYAQAIPFLEAIVKEYAMMKWDGVAARYLAQAYLGLKRPKDAVEYLRKLPPELLRSGELVRVYWDALRQAGYTTELKKALLDSIERGSRDVAALAQVVRGDIDFDKNNFKDALIDGYLRTIFLFQDIRAIQPEALYKAMKAHEKLGEHSHAEKHKRKLLQEFPESSYSRQLRG